MDKFLFVGNGSYLNRGCEAIVRGTVNILRHSFDGCRCDNANFDTSNPAFMPNENDPDIVHHPLPKVQRWSVDWGAMQLLRRLKSGSEYAYMLRRTNQLIRQSDAVLSIGGDNYSLDYGIPWKFVYLDKHVAKFKKPLVIWGASIGPFEKEPAFRDVILDHLRHEVTAIFVRERKSFEYLKNYNISSNLSLMPDPAFMMNPEEITEEQLGFQMSSDAIGFNIGPLMLRYVANFDRNTLIEMSAKLLETLRKATGRPLVLIPHVTSPHSDDHRLLKEIYQQLSSNANIFLVPPALNAAQTKWLISKLSVLVASRTHATIAGFSSAVPTVSLAYSVKALGINHDLFGHTDYVVSPEDFSISKIENTTLLALKNEKTIRNTLGTKMEEIQKQALAAGHMLKTILDSSGIA